MGRKIALILFATLTTPLCMSAALASGPARRSLPSGVTPSSWVPVTDSLGAIIERRMPDRYSGGQRLHSVLGYFAVWRDGHWLRLDSLLLQSTYLRSAPSASKWISIGSNLRFVIERQAPTQPMQGQPAVPSALGYFVVKRGSQWLRLAPDPQGALYRGPLRPPSTSEWIPISKSLRFVIEQQMPERYAPPLNSPSVLGYFTSKRRGRWLRLASIA